MSTAFLTGSGFCRPRNRSVLAGNQSCAISAKIHPSRRLSLSSRVRHSCSISMSTLRVAAVGCVHGELDAIYDAVSEAVAASRDGRQVDLIVCAGDFQAVRNASDLECMSVPDKYKHMRSFWKYYAGQQAAPVPTVFVGGNHEASNHLQELPLGGFVAPNIYYMGNSSVINFRGLRIAGISGVYVEHNYLKPRFEEPPYEATGSLKSVYHVRKADVEMLSRITRPVDVFVSHDWPKGIVDFGDKAQLLREKPYLTKEINDGRFGNPGTKELLHILKPSYWFAAHMHVKFAAVVPHAGSDAVTRFLALDKALPRRDFVQILDIPVTNEFQPSSINDDIDRCGFHLDPEWLAVLRSNSHSKGHVTDKEIAETVTLVQDAGLRMWVTSPDDFDRTAQRHVPSSRQRSSRPTCLQIQSRNVQLADALGLQLRLLPQVHMDAATPVNTGAEHISQKRPADCSDSVRPDCNATVKHARQSA